MEMVPCSKMLCFKLLVATADPKQRLACTTPFVIMLCPSTASPQIGP